jgi:hypothetical protein
LRQHIGSHSPSLLGPSGLVEPEVNAAVDSRIVDVRSHFLQGGVFEPYFRQLWMRHHQRVSARAEGVLQYFTRGVTQRRVAGWVSRKTRRGNQRHECGIRRGSIVAVRCSGWHRGFRPPRVVVIFRFQHGDRGIGQRDIEQGEGARILHQGAMRRLSQLSRDRVPENAVTDDVIHSRHLGAIGRPGGAVSPA